MNSDVKNMELELICIIVNYGMGSKIAKTAKHSGISGDTILLARGTVGNQLCDYIGLSDIRKEVLYLIADRETAYQALEKINNEYKFHKPNHGIAFTTSISAVSGKRICKSDNMKYKKGGESIMYHVITTIVDKGKAEDAIDAAARAGSKGGTIINGRGSGIHETSRLFNMDIEPEKEIVIILSETEMTEKIVMAIREELKIDEAGKGIIYVQDVNKTYGVYK
jgi:nitrogen regulatory protein PII